MASKACTVNQCDNNIGPKGARGYCTKHYQMWRLTGDPCGSTAPHPAQRFWVKVRKTQSCWLWMASVDGNGYGVFSDKRTHRAHRWAYEQLVGPVPEGLVLDHLCRTPMCVNPSHLEPVTNDENLERGWGRRVKNGMTNSCINGHMFTTDNTYINTKGRKVCRICKSAAHARYENRKALNHGPYRI